LTRYDFRIEYDFGIASRTDKRYLGRVMKLSPLNVDAWVQNDPRDLPAAPRKTMMGSIGALTIRNVI
jgi:hypothetical protein